MIGYTKLFGTILDSSIWVESKETKILWITMLAMAGKEGYVEAAIPGLAKRANLSLSETEHSLSCLLSPDKYSRTKEHDGRRIQEIEGGWLILNHAKYREKMSADERREYLRAKQAEHRAKSKSVNTVSTNVNNVSDKSTPSTHSEAASASASSPNSDKAYGGTKAFTKERILTRLQAAIAARFESALNKQWRNDSGKWINRIVENVGKAERVIAEVESAIKEGRIQTSPAQFAEDTWKRFEVQP